MKLFFILCSFLFCVAEPRNFANVALKLIQQRWSPRGHIFKSLASKPQVLENWPVLGSRTALFFEWLKFCRSAEKCFSRPFFWRSTEKKFLRPFFVGKHLHLCPWSLASSILVLGLVFFCVLGLGLEPCVLDSTSVIQYH